MIGAASALFTVSASAQEGPGPLRADGPPIDGRKPFAAFSDAALALSDSVVALARAQSGTRYRLGGETPKGGFDCSGLV